MEAKDLMVGIFAYFNCFDGTCITVKVTGFKDNIVYGVSENGSHWCTIEKVEPIPLTSEILEKNGFVKLLSQYVLEADKEPFIHLIPLGNMPNANGSMLVAIKDRYTNAKIAITYVHELQHALRLCGIEKEIEL